MTRLTLLLPASTHVTGMALPVLLGKALGRADRMQQVSGEQAQLARYFRPLPNRWAHAALTRVFDAGIEDAQSNQWLRADPAHIRPDINGVRLLGIGRTLGLEQGDADALLPALRPLFGDFGFTLDAPHPTRWYLRLPREAKLPTFATPELALGDDLFEHIPDGAEARRWRVLANEAQVVLHNHPHNAARLDAGRVAINSLWFWGEGGLPDTIASESTTLYSDDPLLHGIAKLGKLIAMPLDACNTLNAGSLLDLRGERDPLRLVERWLLPTLALACEVRLDFGDGVLFSLRRNQRWRIWRKPLTTLP